MSIEFAPTVVRLDAGEPMRIETVPPTIEAAAAFLKVEQRGYAAAYVGTDCLDAHESPHVITQQDAESCMNLDIPRLREELVAIANGTYAQNKSRNYLLLRG